MQGILARTSCPVHPPLVFLDFAHSGARSVNIEAVRWFGRTISDDGHVDRAVGSERVARRHTPISDRAITGHLRPQCFRRQLIADAINFPVAHVKALLLLKREGSRPDPPEHGRLVPAFVHRTIPIEAFRYRNGGSMSMVGRDQFGGRAGAESSRSGIGPRGKQLNHAQPVVAISQVCKCACAGHPDLDVANVVDFSTRGEGRFQLG